MKSDDQFATKLYEKGVRVTGAVTIQRSASELYDVWRSFADLPRFIDDLEAVERTDERRTRWTVKGPAGKLYSWEAQIINEEPARLLAWRTEADTGVPNAGSISFKELAFNRGTEVKAVVHYLPPAGAVGESLAKALGNDPKTLLRRGLHRFRQLMETGEVAVSAGQPVGANPRRKDRPGEALRRTDANLRDLANTEGAP